MSAPELSDFINTVAHSACYGYRVAGDNGVVAANFLTQGVHQELIDFLKVGCRVGGPGEN